MYFGKRSDGDMLVNIKGGHFDKREAIFDELLKRGVLIRVVGPDGWLRVCMGTDEEMETFRNALVEVLRIVEAA